VRTKARHVVLTLVVLAPVTAVVWQQSAPGPAAPRASKRTTRPATKPASRPAPPPVVVPPPKPLANPPRIVRAAYFTEYSAGLRRKLDYLVDLHRTTDINGVVFDVKDYSGYLCYRTGVPQAAEYGAIRRTISNLDATVGRLHAENIYVIARFTCFQDPVLARARPDLAVHRLSKLPPKDKRGKLTADSLWLDRKGLAWIDPGSRAAWEYLAALGKDALSHGIDELNFDYIRFPSDGDLKDMYFPHWDSKTPKHQVIGQFFAYLRHEFEGTPISADLFGLATVNGDDLGIGQVIEDAYRHFDYVCPMVYPSHYARQFLGFPNPAAHPYEVVDYSMKEALRRLVDFRTPKPTAPAAAKSETQPPAAPAQPIRAARLRPWIQDFKLGARYDAPMVRAQIQAAEDALGEDFAGYLVWNPSNIYTRDALKPPPPPAEAAKTASAPASQDERRQ
jgi:hypothetical protein